MAEKFDPYYEWLSIPPEEQPPNHYRLLGVQFLEKNPAFISNAAEQRIVYLRTFQIGPRSAESQKLLNEIAAAKVCLLNSAKKADYDRALQTRLQKQPATAEDTGRRLAPGADVAPEKLAALGPAGSVGLRKTLPITSGVVLGACGAGLVGLIVWLLASSGKPAAKPAPSAEPSSAAAANFTSAPSSQPKPLVRNTEPPPLPAPPSEPTGPSVATDATTVWPPSAPAPPTAAKRPAGIRRELPARMSVSAIGKTFASGAARAPAAVPRPADALPPAGAERQAVLWVLKKGGQILILADSTRRLVAAAAQLPPQAVVVAGVHLQHNKNLTDDDLVNLAPLTNVDEVLLGGDNLSGVGCKHLAGLAKLRWLSLALNPVTNQGLAQIGKLSQLMHLNLHGCTRFNDVGLEHLASLKDLNVLELGMTGTTDKGLSCFGNLTNLVTLALPHTRVTDVGLLHLKGLHKLKSVNVAKTRVTARGIHLLKTCLPECEVRE